MSVIMGMNLFPCESHSLLMPSWSASLFLVCRRFSIGYPTSSGPVDLPILTDVWKNLESKDRGGRKRAFLAERDWSVNIFSVSKDIKIQSMLWGIE